MKKNMGKADRVIRFIVAVIVIVLFATEVISRNFRYLIIGLCGHIFAYQCC
nr:DUF2892 domain-containing protein [Lacinutrix neustonica]